MMLEGMVLSGAIYYLVLGLDNYHLGGWDSQLHAQHLRISHDSRGFSFNDGHSLSTENLPALLQR